MIRINLLREPASRTKLWVPKKSRAEIYLVIFIALAVVSMGLWQWRTGSRLVEAQDRKADLQQQSLQVVAVRAELTRMQQLKAQLEERAQSIERLKASQTGPVRMMNAIIASVPPQPRLWLTRLTQEKQLVKIEGQSFDVPAIADFIAKLGQTAPFESVELDFWQVNDRSVNFELSCSVGGE